MPAPGQSRHRNVRRLVLAAALGLVFVFALAGSASAHATLIESNPAEGSVLAAAPSQVRFTFDEPVRSTPGGVHLFDAAGKELDADGKTRDAELLVDLPSGLGQGTFIVTWRVVSSDGHPIAGALTFSVGAPSETVAAVVAAPTSSPVSVRTALGLAQGLTYLGVFGASGLMVFGLMVLPRAPGTEQLRARLLSVASGFGWLLVAAGMLTVLLTTMYQRGLGFSALFGDEPFEIPTNTELVAYGVAVLGVWAALLRVRGPVGQREDRDRSVRVTAVIAIAVALGSLGLVGHTRAYPPLGLMLAADLAHVAAGSIWFGGLIGLVLTLRKLAERPRLAAEALGSFSLLAGWLLLGVGFTGSLLGWRILGSWSALVDTDFGRVLLVKVAVVGAAALVAAWNRYRLMPSVLAESGFAERAAASARMRRVIRVEAVMLVGVLGLTGFLVDRSPAPAQGAVALPGGLDASTYTGLLEGVRVVAVVEPASIGRNSVLFQLQDAAGNPLEPWGLPELSATDGEVVLGDQAATNVDSGTYRASVLIPRAGTWSFRFSVPLSEFDNPVVSVKVPVIATR